MPKFYARRRLSILAALTGVIASVALFNGPTASAALPTPVSAATARTYLASLTVATEDRTGYEPRPVPASGSPSRGTCNTRETVLKRDGTNVVTDSACAATSGSWYSPYDGATWTAASDLDIDHLVPLAEAWDSGASGWTTVPAPGLRQRPDPPAADRRHGQRQPVQGRPGPGRLDAVAHGLPLHLRPRLGPGEVLLRPLGRLGREERAHELLASC